MGFLTVKSHFWDALHAAASPRRPGFFFLPLSFTLSLFLFFFPLPLSNFFFSFSFLLFLFRFSFDICLLPFANFRYFLEKLRLWYYNVKREIRFYFGRMDYENC